jgi:hypothetical protein
LATASAMYASRSTFDDAVLAHLLGGTLHRLGRADGKDLGALGTQKTLKVAFEKSSTPALGARSAWCARHIRIRLIRNFAWPHRRAIIGLPSR